MLFGRRSGDNERRQIEDRRRFIPLSFYIWCGESLLKRSVRALFRGFGKVLKWVLILVAWFRKVLKWVRIFVATVIAMLVLGGVIFWYVPEIINAVDQYDPDLLDEQFGSKRALVDKLSDPAYYAEQSEVYADGKRFACFSSPVHRLKIDDIQSIPPLIRAAILASEDKSFYRHPGVDMGAIARAGFKRYVLHESFSGASTMPMQMAKELRGGTGRSSTEMEKVQDIITALRIELRYSKDEILLRYVNMPYFGRGMYGVETASRAYFGKPSWDLTAYQAAFLVSLINKPALPDRRHTKEKVEGSDAVPDRGHAKVNGEGSDAVAEANWADVIIGTRRVLTRMKEDGYIAEDVISNSDDAIEKSLRTEIIPRPSGCGTKGYFIEHVRTEHKDKLPMNTGGLEIFLTRDDGLQEKLEEAVKLTVKKFEDRYKSDPDNALIRAGAIAIQFNGDVLALVGNIDFARIKFDVMTDGWRQPGSLFKMFVYGGLVEEKLNDILLGPSPPLSLDELVAQVTKECVVLDAPVGVRMGNGEVKPIQNFHSSSGKTPQYWGQMTCKEALGRSQNAAAMRAGEMAGIRNIIDLTYRLGMPEDKKHPLQPYPTTAIGASEVNPRGMVGTISFVNGGYEVTLRFVYDICKDKLSLLSSDDDGRPAPCDSKGERRITQERVIHPVTSIVMTDILRGPLDDPFGTMNSLRTGVIPGIDPLGGEMWELTPKERKERTLAFSFESSGEIAGKTGTATNQNGKTSDVWMILFVPGPEAYPEKGVMLLFWMGKDSKNHALGERGSTGGNIAPETGGRNWKHSASLVLQFLQKERGLLRPGNKFRPVREDDILTELRKPRAEAPIESDEIEEGVVDLPPEEDLSLRFQSEIDAELNKVRPKETPQDGAQSQGDAETD